MEVSHMQELKEKLYRQLLKRGFHLLEDTENTRKDRFTCQARLQKY